MALLSWGCPDIYIRDLSEASSKWKKVPTPAEGTTELTTTKGDKTEAKFEGGEIEDVRYAKNTYALAYQIRLAKSKVMPFDSEDGKIDKEYAVAVVPEDNTTPGILIDRSHVSAEDSYSAADGITITYTHDALRPESGNQVKYGVVSVTGDAATGFEVKIATEVVHSMQSKNKAVV